MVKDRIALTTVFIEKMVQKIEKFGPRHGKSVQGHGALGTL